MKQSSVNIADRHKDRLRDILVDFFTDYARNTKPNLNWDTPEFMAYLYARIDGIEKAMEETEYKNQIDLIFRESGDNIIDIIPSGAFLTKYRFDMLYETTYDSYKPYRFKSIHDFLDDTASAIKTAIDRALRQQKAKQEILKIFRLELGINSQQEQATENYRNYLQNGSSLALTYENRDKEKDKWVKDAIAAGIILSPKRIDSLIKAYILNSKRYRMNMIAENEALNVASLGEYESIIQAGLKGALDLNSIVKVWRTQGDEKVRANHVVIPIMNPDGVGVLETFRTPLGNMRYPRDSAGTPDNIINCRCYLTYKLRQN